MVESKSMAEFEDPEIGQLKEWLSKVSGDNRAYLKGASKALLYVQEINGLPSDLDTPGFEKRGADFRL